jgi:predicted nucleic acid-binding protein
MKAFFNTSPIIFLYKLGILDRLVPALWDTVYITSAVADEVNDKNITDRPYFSHYHVQDKLAVMAMPESLHKGETESIISAIESGVYFLVLDDFKARRKAESLGIDTMGTIGVILLASQKSIISVEEAIKFLHDLREHSFWINEELFKKIIRQLKRKK